MIQDDSYEWVENYFFDNGSQCGDCKFCECTKNWSYFGSQRVSEDLYECKLLNSGHTDQCPALIDKAHRLVL